MQESISGTPSSTGARIISDAHLLLEAIELHDFGAPLQDLELVALGGATPLRAGDVASLEGDCLAAARGLPTQTSIREPAFAILLGEVQVDVVETLHRRSPSCARFVVMQMEEFVGKGAVAVGDKTAGCWWRFWSWAGLLEGGALASAAFAVEEKGNALMENGVRARVYHSVQVPCTY